MTRSSFQSFDTIHSLLASEIGQEVRAALAHEAPGIVPAEEGRQQVRVAPTLGQALRETTAGPRPGGSPSDRPSGNQVSAHPSLASALASHRDVLKGLTAADVAVIAAEPATVAPVRPGRRIR